MESAGEKGGKRTRLEKLATTIMDPEKGNGESRGLGNSRLNKLQGLGTGRERLAPEKPGRVGRRPQVVTSSHDAKARRRKIASDPERVSDDGG